MMMSSFQAGDLSAVTLFLQRQSTPLKLSIQWCLIVFRKGRWILEIPYKIYGYTELTRISRFLSWADSLIFKWYVSFLQGKNSRASLAVRFLEGQNRNESSQGQDLKFKPFWTASQLHSNCHSKENGTWYCPRSPDSWCQKYKVLTIHNSQASEGAIHITLEQKPTDSD